MKKIRSGLFLMITLCLLTACKSGSLNEAIDKQIPFNIVKILHIEKIKEGAVVLYLTEQEWRHEKVKVLSVAFMKGSDKKGWENAGHNHWEYSDDLNLTIHPDAFYDYDKKGNLQRKISVIYGQLKNDKIESIEISGRANKYEEALIIAEKDAKYYFKLGEYDKARGITKDGKKIKRKRLNEPAF